MKYLLIVLILILLEYGLRHMGALGKQVSNYPVLILILLEYGLRPLEKATYEEVVDVLILILLEYGLRHTNAHDTQRFDSS